MNDSDNSYLTVILDQILKDYLANMNEYFLIAKGITFIGLIISIYFAYFDIMATGNNEAINKFLKKFMLIFLGIFYYSTFIMIINAPLDAITNVIRNVSISDNNYNNNSAFAYSPSVIGQSLSMITNGNQVNSEKNNSAEMNKKLLSYLPGSDYEDTTSNPNGDSLFTDALAYGTNIAMDTITSMIINLFMMIAEVCNMVLSVIRGFYLIILTIFGIFVIALSSFPTLENSFTQWLTKYINVYLWLAIGFVLQGIMARLQKMLIDSPVDELHAQANVYSVLVALSTIIGYIAIPSISSWLINASTNQVSGKMGGTVQMAARKMLTKGKSK